jgi:putative alpha-1,2-mannosidase
MHSLNHRLASLLLAGAAVLGANAADFDPLQYVDQLIGSRDGGNVFPGATLPYGLAKAVADTNSGSNQGGFTLDGTPITGFSALHDSGTGGDPSLGNFPLFPYAACPDDDINKCDYPKKTRLSHGSFDPKTVVARPGFFGVTLNGGIKAEMTATQRTALFRFTFPTTTNGSHPLLLQDLTDLHNSRQDNGSVSVDPTTGRIKGQALFVSSFSQGQYVAYFCTDFSGSKIVDNGIFVDSRASTDVKSMSISRSINGYPLPGGAFVRFESAANPVTARVGLSFISSDQACSNAEAEIPTFDFNAVDSAATDAWRKKLSPIVVSTGGGVDPDQIKNFYSGIYRTLVNPQNYTGENPYWNTGEPYFDSFYW